MNERQRRQAEALGRCSFLPGSAEKRFCRDMAARAALAAPPELTERQAAYLERLCWRFRRQLPAHLVPSEQPA
ncbi:MAG TPA: hypothetical protein VMU59_14335 [Caulobacteraceae bacterium]|nr:hypothetical protein [Caulobacteraceae bacterium]